MKDIDVTHRGIIQEAIARYALRIQKSPCPSPSERTEFAQLQRPFECRSVLLLSPYASEKIHYILPTARGVQIDFKEIPTLSCLIIQGRPDPGQDLLLHSFPLEIGMCQQLCVLSLQIFSFWEFPYAILRLRQVQVLEFIGASAVPFPPEIGESLRIWHF